MEGGGGDVSETLVCACAARGPALLPAATVGHACRSPDLLRPCPLPAVQALLDSSDVVLPLGAPALPPALAAAAASPSSSPAESKLLGAGALPGAARLAWDSVALQAALAERGFPALRLLRLGLANFEGLNPQQPLEDSPAYRAVADW